MLRNIFLFLLLASSSAFAQQNVPGKPQKTSSSASKILPADLYHEILRADSLLFHAFNNCDTATYRKFITEDLEFYHDQGGQTIGADNELKSIKEMCARGHHMRRELIRSTLEVHPLKGYGAIEIGSHTFYHTNEGQQEKISGTYKFVQIWEFKDGFWKLKRVISYDHSNVHND
ncbi:ketosteroid isomerase-like protein [Pedobacter cryoconitis]|uniref:Ketosteroid isomerase-like protein n=1 Tax=Pedobacter cryoconitis TaxID=188932 RepID=A0A7W9DX08_9SPHI|nr:nuclear transport factor 2 family protein [Pedobacter cryoconitis]MBB5634431.1 ketosteroid isomerase-like protein [Pedobacter cryoconitis]MBB6272444.1 ketosteroid isomerase-like protein [Pedobacter cryoconitis]